MTLVDLIFDKVNGRKTDEAWVWSIKTLAVIFSEGHQRSCKNLTPLASHIAPTGENSCLEFW